MRRLFLLTASLAFAAQSARAATCPPGLFLEAPTYPTGVRGVAIVAANFNGDTILDLAVANRDGTSVSVLLGNGDGTFGPPIISPSNSGQQSMVAADFDGDGNTDLAVGGYYRVTILLGNGDGTFQPPVEYDVGNGPVSSIQAGKLDAGNTMDLVTTSDYDGAVDVLLGVGDGTFGPAQSYPAGGQARSLALGDYNDDDVLDVVVTHPYGNTVSLLLGQGDGSFGAPSPFVVGMNPGDVLAGDFNDDGQLDAVVQTGQYVSVLLGDGSGGFGAALQYPAGLDPGAFAAGDFDGDGNADLAVQSNSGGGQISVLLGDGSGAFAPSAVYLTGQYGDAIVPGDLNGDGTPDLATSNPGTFTVSVLLANGNGSFEASRSVAVPGGASVLATGFFNADSILDIAAVNGGPVQILLGDPAGGYVLGGSYDVGVPATSVIAADFTNDSITDLVISSNYGYVGAWLLRGVGDGTFVPAPNGISTASYAGNMVAGLFDGDGPVDLAIATGCCGFGGIEILPGNGDGTFRDPIYTDLGSTPGGLAASDLNWDGATDLATTDASHNRVLVLLGNGDGTFQTPVAYPAQQGPAWLVAGWDIDEDGNTDIVVANTNSQNLSILRGLGDGTFAPGPILALGQPAVFVASGNFDGDDHYDLYTANGSGNSVSVFRGIGAGAFASPRTYLTGANATYAVIVDADNNSRIDLAVATPGDSAITLLLNAGLGIGTIGGSLNACVGSSLTLSVEASGFGPLGYQWIKDQVPLSDGGNISGAQTAHLTIFPVGGLDNGTYSVAVNDLCTTLEGFIDYVYVHDPPAAPVITIDSIPAPGIPGTASATAGGTDYFWSAVGGVITGGQHTSTATFLTDVPGTVTLKATEYSAPACGTESAPTDVVVDYLDVPPSNIFHADIAHDRAGPDVTAGCGDGNYCPSNLVTRAQMAVFLLKSELWGSAHTCRLPARGLFADVPSRAPSLTTGSTRSPRWRNHRLRNRQLLPRQLRHPRADGRLPLKTCMVRVRAPCRPPRSSTTSPSTPSRRTSSTTSTTRGITGGCSASPLLYCPNNPVSRAQMAAFLSTPSSRPSLTAVRPRSARPPAGRAAAAWRRRRGRDPGRARQRPSASRPPRRRAGRA